MATQPASSSPPLRFNNPALKAPAGLGGSPKIRAMNAAAPTGALALLTAVALGALHALEPSHGKAVIGAYLVGKRRSVAAALQLAAIVAFTHTFSVIALALLARWGAARLALTGRALAVGAGLLIVALGLFGVVRFFLGFRHSRAHEPGHPHIHPLEDQPFVIHPEDEPAPDDTGHGHVHGGLGELLLLGIAGGLVPCFEGVALLGGAAALGHPARGLFWVLAFSGGLGGVVLALGLAFIGAQGWLEAKFAGGWGRGLRYAPVISSALILLFGLAMTGFALAGASLE